uniref:Uncharacterized protein n=1 Tax=Setaria viridis TaxID=4556 RepID=A0A4U6T0K2_SETVI|nr:hypothetical protein SEVIR_9G265400v2 [Setaria viridis]
MDPNSTYCLEINLLGSPKKARKDAGLFCFEQIVDCDLTNFKDFIVSIVEKYPPHYWEVAHVHYYDDVLKTYPEIKSDQELMSMFEKHSKTKVVHMSIAYCDPTEPYDPIIQWHKANPSGSFIEEDEDSYLCNPLPEKEHVGVDEELMYLEDAPVHVRKNPCAHDCSSTRRKKMVKNATKHWVYAKVLSLC